MNDAFPVFRNIARTLSRAFAVAVLAFLPLAAALAADARRSSLPDASAPFGPVGWGLVVALGLLAVAAGALTMGRPSRPSLRGHAANDSELGTTLAGPHPDPAHAAAEAHGGQEASSRREATPAAVPAAVPAVAPEWAAHAADATPGIGPKCTAPGVDASPDSAPARETGCADPPGARGFLALHHVDLSIDVLHRHIEDDSRPMPAVWVMLLDLCRTHGREQKFRELALEFHRRFNVRRPSWDRYPPGRDEPGLEAYPRLVKAITAAWGTHECRRLLDRLLYDNRGGSRRGFTLNAYNDLIALRRAAHSVLETIEADLALEARRPAPMRPVAAPDAVSANDASASPSPLMRDLQDQLDRDLDPGAASQSALEREHPAFASVLVREWGNAALAGRLCEMLARGSDGAPPVSAEAAEELELLRRMAERLGAPERIAAAGD